MRTKFSPLLLTILFVVSLFFQFKIVNLQNDVNDLCQDYIAIHNYFSSQAIYQIFPQSLCWQSPNYPGKQYPAHPPTALLFFLPLHLSDLPTATLIWDFVHPILYLLILLVLLIYSRFFRLRLLIILFCISSVWISLLLTYSYRNLYLILLLLITLSLCLVNRKPGWSGFLIAIASLLKLWPVIFLALGVFRPKYLRFTISGLVTLVLGIALSLAIFGPHNFKTYFYQVLPFEKVFINQANNLSLTSTLYRSYLGTSVIFYPPPPILISQLITISFLCILIFTIIKLILFLRYPVSPSLFFSVAITFYFVFSPLSWDGSAIFLLLPLATFFRYLPTWRNYLNTKLIIQISLGFLPFWVPQTLQILTRFFTNFPANDFSTSLYICLAFLLTSLPIFLITSQIYFANKSHYL